MVVALLCEIVTLSCFLVLCARVFYGHARFSRGKSSTFAIHMKARGGALLVCPVRSTLFQVREDGLGWTCC